MSEKKLTYLSTDIDKKMLQCVDNKAAYLDYREEFAQASNFKKRFDYPIHVDIELTNTCNYKCSICVHGKDETKQKEYYKTKFILQKEKIFEILNECKKMNVKSIQLNVNNEPLLYKDLIEVVEYAGRLKFPDIYFITNASLLKKEISEKLIKSGCTKIMFSLDAFSEDIYYKVRLTKCYHEIVNNILQFIELKKKLHTELPLTRVSFVITEINRHQMNEFKEFWESKVDFIAFQNLIRLDQNRMQNGRKAKDLKDYRCNMPNFRLTIKADGNVKPCCVFYGEDLNIGNIFTEKLSDIWNKDSFKQFQEMHKQYNWQNNEICKDCVTNSEL